MTTLVTFFLTTKDFYLQSTFPGHAGFAAANRAPVIRDGKLFPDAYGVDFDDKITGFYLIVYVFKMN